MFLTLLTALWTIGPMTTQGAEAEPQAQDIDDVAGGGKPQLRLETGGPTAYVSALAFDPRPAAPNGDALYVAGWNKVVDVWRAAPGEGGLLARDAPGTLRIPIAPQLYGAINTMAVAPDGGELAVAGNAVTRGASAWDQPGRMISSESRTPEVLDDQGTLYVFDTRTGSVRQLRGNHGRVIAATYAVAAAKGGKPRRLLVSAAVAGSPGPETKLVIQARDTGTEKLLGECRVPFIQKQRPALAAWSFGDRPEQVAVAICAGQPDELLRLWNVDTRQVFKVADHENNKTVAFWPEQRKLITGGSNQLTLWAVPGAADGEPRLLDRRVIKQGRDDLVPHAMVLFASRANGPRDRLATVVHSMAPGRNGWDKLLLMDISGGGLPHKFNNGFWLWENADRKMPVIAASPDGRRLALAGEATHDVRLYETAKLAPGRDDGGRKTLRSKALGFKQAWFVNKGDRVGLWLSPSSSTEREPRVFNPAGQGLTTDVGGWTLSQADANGWNVRHGVEGEAPNRRVWLQVRHGKQVMPAIWLENGLELTAHALLPPTPASLTPILAVASHDLGQPDLRLYDAASGVFFRQLNGHVERIRSLAFDRSGRLLVSTADDRTVRVWSMLDVLDSLGARGALPDVTIVSRKPDGPGGPGGEPRLVVRSVKRAPPGAAEGLRVDDEILGIVAPEKLQSFSSPLEFYNALFFEYQPGQTVVLRCAAPGQAARDVSLVVGQATDERMPLFSLCVTGRAPSPEWIGWAPWGEYEASGQAAEQHVTWHFNTGRADDPVRIAAVSEYQKLKRPGLLEALLATGKPPGPPPPPQPAKLTLRLEPAAQTRPLDGKPEVVLVDGPDTKLAVAIDEFDPNLIESVTWHWLDDERPRQPDQPAAQEMSPVGASRHDWAVDASQLDWRRGARRLGVTVVSREEEPRRFEAAIDTYYSPPPPTVRIETPSATSAQSERKEFTLRAIAEAGSQRHARFAVTLEHSAAGKKREWVFEGEKQLAIEQKLSLESGDNFLRLTARNADAPAANWARETSSPVECVVSYQPQAPSIAVEAVGAGSRRMLRQRDMPANGEPLGVDQRSFRLRGAIQAPDNLTLAEWRAGSGEWQTVAGFKAGSQKKIDVDEQFELAPGTQSIECRAKTADSQEIIVGLTAHYRPRLPEFSVDDPPDGLIAEAPRMTLSGHWAPADDARPFKAELRRNGVLSPNAVRLDVEQERFSVTAPIERGDNLFELRFWNEWSEKPVLIERTVVRRRPPRIVTVEAPADVRDPNIELRCQVESPAGLPINRLTINGDEVAIDAREPKGGGWRLSAHYDRLAQGENNLSIVAFNEDGPSAAVRKKVHLTAPRREPPKIAFQRPVDGRAQRQQSCRVAFTVSSPTELADARLLLNDREVFRANIDGQRRDARDQFRLSSGDVDLTLLANQANTLTVRATNTLGLVQRRSVSVTHVSPPARVVVDEIRPDDGAPPLKPRMSGNRSRFEAAAPTGRVVLKGHVTYTPADPQLDEPAGVRMRVNSYYQMPATLQKKTMLGGQPVRYWQAPLYLNAARNEVAVELPGTVKDVRNRLDFQLACGSPIDFPRLHLLVVGVGLTSARQLEEEALRLVAGQATRAPGVEFTTPVFKEGHLYGPYVRRSLNRQSLMGYLADARRQMERSAKQPGTDLFMLCYRGALVVETQARSQFYLLTNSSQGAEERPQDNGLRGDRLAQMFENSPGAQVLLLDVERGRTPSPKSPGLGQGAIRYAWLGRTRSPQNAYVLGAFREAVNAAASGPMFRQMTELVAWLESNIEIQAQIPPILYGLVLAQPATPP